MGENHSLQKADQWQQFASVMPIIFFVCWRDDNDRITATTTPVHQAAKLPSYIDHCLDHVYQLCLLLSTAVRLFTSCAVTLSDVDWAQLLPPVSSYEDSPQAQSSFSNALPSFLSTLWPGICMVAICIQTLYNRIMDLSSYINNILFIDGQINKKIKLDTKIVFKVLY